MCTSTPPWFASTWCITTTSSAIETRSRRCRTCGATCATSSRHRASATARTSSRSRTTTSWCTPISTPPAWSRSAQARRSSTPRMAAKSSRAARSAKAPPRALPKGRTCWTATRPAPSPELALGFSASALTLGADLLGDILQARGDLRTRGGTRGRRGDQLNPSAQFGDRRLVQKGREGLLALPAEVLDEDDGRVERGDALRVRRRRTPHALSFGDQLAAGFLHQAAGHRGRRRNHLLTAASHEQQDAGLGFLVQRAHDLIASLADLRAQLLGLFLLSGQLAEGGHALHEAVDGVPVGVLEGVNLHPAVGEQIRGGPLGTVTLGQHDQIRVERQHLLRVRVHPIGKRGSAHRLAAR